MFASLQTSIHPRSFRYTIVSSGLFPNIFPTTLTSDFEKYPSALKYSRKSISLWDSPLYFMDHLLTIRMLCRKLGLVSVLNSPAPGLKALFTLTSFTLSRDRPTDVIRFSTRSLIDFSLSALSTSFVRDPCARMVFYLN